MNFVELSTISKYMIFPGREDVNYNLSSSRSNFEQYPYRHNSTYYRGDSVGSTEVLLENIKNSLKNISNKKPLLLLSDGKDSMGLALAYSELGISIDTLTFLRDDDYELKEFIEKTCLNLGHRPYFVTSSEILSSYSSDYFVYGCSSMSSLVLDQGFIYFLFGIKCFFNDVDNTPKEYVIVDGLGNDETFGYIPSKDQLRSLILSQLGLWKYIPKFSDQLRWYFRSPSESHGDLSALSCYFKISQAQDVNSYFDDINSYGDSTTIIDYRAFVRGKFHDHQCMMGKSRAAAKAIGCDVIFPWTDESLADYLFNLPAEFKFDFKKLHNKKLLRNLLESKIKWQQVKRGIDMYYDLDLDFFEMMMSSLNIPSTFLDSFKRKDLLPSYVKKRALLEFMNLYGFCRSRGITDKEVKKILL